MRLPKSAHESRPWRIREIVPDFRLEDVWALPVHGGSSDFSTFVQVMTSLDPADTPSVASRVLIDIRLHFGRFFGWDRARQLPIPDTTEASLRHRLHQDLRNTASGERAAALENLGVRLTPLYRTADEFAAELSNETVHGVIHLAWVKLGGGRFQGQMAIYVKPHGLFGKAYMAIIKPFRYWVVYPALMRQIERAWDTEIARRSEALNDDRRKAGVGSRPGRRR